MGLKVPRRRAAVFPRKLLKELIILNSDFQVPNTLCISPLMRSLPHTFGRRTLNVGGGDYPNQNLQQTSWLRHEIKGRLGNHLISPCWPLVIWTNIPLIIAVPQRMSCDMKFIWPMALTRPTWHVSYLTVLFSKLNDKIHEKVFSP